MRPLVSCLLAALCVASLLACGSANLSAPATDVAADPPAADAQTTTSDAAVWAGDAPADLDPAGAGPFAPPPVAPPSEGTQVAVETWAVAVVFNPQKGDPVADALAAGTFAAPKPGTMAYGLNWAASKQGADGALPKAGNANTLVYAATTLTLDTPMGLQALADRAYEIWIDGRVQPADVYGFGKMFAPFHLGAGTHSVVVGGRGGPGFGIRLVTSTHEVALNALDKTQPDLRVGVGGDVLLGLATLCFGPEAAIDVRARVLENDRFHATVVELPALAPGATTMVPFKLALKKAPSKPTAGPDDAWKATLQLDAPSWKYSYQQEISLSVVAIDAPFSQTFSSPDDGSVQYYGARPPVGYDGKPGSGLVLSLHGAGVDARGQVDAYASKDWAWIIAGTNRRNFGFDWEEWGRMDAIFALDDAMARFGVDPARVHLAGHSMGGHGTWHVGVHHAGRFATLGPSAGWNSFYTYGGAAAMPKGPFAAARAHSVTTDYMVNLTNRAVYLIHGTADNVVPIGEAYTLEAAAKAVTSLVDHHWEPGAGHWWDNTPEIPGADCVDWPQLFDLMKNRKLDPTELTFTFKSSAPWYSASYSFVTLQSSIDPLKPCTVAAQEGNATAESVTTTNVRSLVLDGKALKAKGRSFIDVDGKTLAVTDGPMQIGPTTGKRPLASGPYNQVFHRPFLFVYPDGATDYANYAAYLVTTWAFIGNGLSGALPASKLTPAIEKAYNLIHLGRDRGSLDVASELPFSAADWGVETNTNGFSGAALMTVFDTGERLNAWLTAPKGQVSLLYALVPFSSRAGMPDYVVWSTDGLRVAGFYTADWTFDPALGVGW